MSFDIKKRVSSKKSEFQVRKVSFELKSEFQVRIVQNDDYRINSKHAYASN